MKTVCEKNKCTGCGICRELCPKRAISFSEQQDVCNAVIREELCVDCGACYNICQVNHSVEKRRPILWKEGWAKDADIRSTSSSGGFAATLELDFVRAGGVVCSCLYKDGSFVFDFVEKEDELVKFKGSKYVKSDPCGIYKKIRKILSGKRRVLFVALPCQVAALKKLTGENEYLYTIDLICHGTPKQSVLRKFLEDYGYPLDDILDISFRTKADFHLERNQKRLVVPTRTDHYTQLFLNSSVYTENCYECPYACLERVSDITLGDSWGTASSEGEQKKGVSIALCQTQKGVELLSSDSLYTQDVNLEKAVQMNHQLEYPSRRNPKREEFFNLLNRGVKFSAIMRKVYPSLYWKGIIKTILYKLGISRSGGDINYALTFTIKVPNGSCE